MNNLNECINLGGCVRFLVTAVPGLRRYTDVPVVSAYGWYARQGSIQYGRHSHIHSVETWIVSWLLPHFAVIVVGLLVVDCWFVSRYGTEGERSRIGCLQNLDIRDRIEVIICQGGGHW